MVAAGWKGGVLGTTGFCKSLCKKDEGGQNQLQRAKEGGGERANKREERRAASRDAQATPAAKPCSAVTRRIRSQLKERKKQLAAERRNAAQAERARDWVLSCTRAWPLQHGSAFLSGTPPRAACRGRGHLGEPAPRSDNAVLGALSAVTPAWEDAQLGSQHVDWTGKSNALTGDKTSGMASRPARTGEHRPAVVGRFCADEALRSQPAGLAESTASASAAAEALAAR